MTQVKETTFAGWSFFQEWMAYNGPKCGNIIIRPDSEVHICPDAPQGSKAHEWANWNFDQDRCCFWCGLTIERTGGTGDKLDEWRKVKPFKIPQRWWKNHARMTIPVLRMQIKRLKKP